MKHKAILVLALILTFSCRYNKKKTVQQENKGNDSALIINYTPEDLTVWSKVRVGLEPATEVNFPNDIFRLSRKSSTEPAYLSSNKIPVIYASRYKVSVIVKKGEESDLFGLRLSGTFPDRVDAVYDLSKGTVKGYRAARDFELPDASIEALSDGWYKCSVSAEVAADDVTIIFGSTSSDKNVSTWEGATKTMGDVYFVPSSIMLEELFR